MTGNQSAIKSRMATGQGNSAPDPDLHPPLALKRAAKIKGMGFGVLFLKGRHGGRKKYLFCKPGLSTHKNIRFANLTRASTADGK